MDGLYDLIYNESDDSTNDDHQDGTNLETGSGHEGKKKQ